MRKNRPRASNASLHLFTHLPVARARSLCTRKPENSKQSETQQKSCVAIGFAVVVAAATVGGVSRGAFNPAVSMLSVVAGKAATIAVYWAGPALGAVLGTGLFKAAYKGESKKKSKRKTR